MGENAHAEEEYLCES
jgi:hypothetical protein